MVNLLRFIPDGVCLSCDGCCRFSMRQTVWAPFFSYEEIVSLTQEDIVPSCVFSHPDILEGSGAQIDLAFNHDTYFCPCFEASSHRCKIYCRRPLDCQLYPFLLARSGEKVFCAVDERCPYVRKVKGTPEVVSYVKYLVDFFNSNEFLAFIKKNPNLLQDYGDDVVCLQSLPAVRQACPH